MENGWDLFNNSSGGRGQNGNCTNVAWDIWEPGTSRFDCWTSSSSHNNSFNQATATTSATATAATAAATPPEASAVHALMLSHHGDNNGYHSSSSSLYAGGGSHYHPDPHLMCLKLGKRHYFEDATSFGDRHVAGLTITKRDKPYYGGGGGGGFVGTSTSAAVTVAASTTVPSCQVEGCHVALVNAKDYHRRHKVCEMHSKAPKVVVLGLEQRFCQQCSRFHAVSEFDDAKRSCRRRLAGHNLRRRKSSHDHSGARNASQESKLMSGRFPCLSSPTGRALSLLSTKNNSWISSADLSSRCSAALRELIAENRAAILARQLILDRDWYWHHHSMEDMNGPQNGSSSLEPHHHQLYPESHSWDRFNEADAHVTLDLMQAPSSAFGFLSVRGKSKEEECSELWSSFEGAHVV